MRSITDQMLFAKTAIMNTNNVSSYLINVILVQIIFKLLILNIKNPNNSETSNMLK
jgi:hypothetical protein